MSVRIQTAQPDPVVIREPYVVTQKEVIREYRSSTEYPNRDLGKLDNKKQEVVKSSQQEQAAEVVNATELMTGKDIGIYYSYGNQSTKSVAAQLVGKMKARGVNASYYSIGRFYSAPSVPSKTYIYGIGSDVDSSEFVSSFREIYHFTGAVQAFKERLYHQPIIDGDKWRMVLDKEI